MNWSKHKWDSLTVSVMFQPTAYSTCNILKNIYYNLKSSFLDVNNLGFLLEDTVKTHKAQVYLLMFIFTFFLLFTKLNCKGIKKGKVRDKTKWKARKNNQKAQITYFIWLLYQAPRTTAINDTCLCTKNVLVLSAGPS